MNSFMLFYTVYNRISSCLENPHKNKGKRIVCAHFWQEQWDWKWVYLVLHIGELVLET